jgi:hypothetical protein
VPAFYISPGLAEHVDGIFYSAEMGCRNPKGASSRRSDWARAAFGTKSCSLMTLLRMSPRQKCGLESCSLDGRVAFR